ncbi:MAG: hypothetical protein IKR19_07625 [Acholeplasmatales bacterium]|nr:hypothetical protein [Acholeplasmatales bacterium]
MLKNHEDRGEATMYSFFSLSTMDEASRKMFARVHAATKKAEKKQSTITTVHHNSNKKAAL